MQRPFRVLTMAVGKYLDGVYPIEFLSTCEEMPPERQVYPRPELASGGAPSANLLAVVDAALASTSIALEDSARAVLDRDFREVGLYQNGFATYVRAPAGIP